MADPFLYPILLGGVVINGLVLACVYVCVCVCACACVCSSTNGKQVHLTIYCLIVGGLFFHILEGG